MAHRGRFQVGQHTGSKQQLIGFGVKLTGLAEDITLEQPEDNQLDLDLQPQLACSLQEVFAEHRRAQGVVQIAQRLARQGTESGRQLIQGQPVAVQHPADHRVHRDCTLALVIGLRRGCLGRQGLGQGRNGRVVLGKPDERTKKLFEKHPLDAFMLETQIAHGLKEDVLLDVTAGSVGHFEEGVVGVVEQRLQSVSQLLRGLVANLEKNRWQSGEWRVSHLVGSYLV